MYHLFHAHAQHGAARVLFFEVVGWGLEPQFAMDVSTLRAMWRTVVKPPAWLEEVPLFQAFPSPDMLLPLLNPTLLRLGWWLSRDSKSLHCVDDQDRVRTVEIGQESFGCVRRWLIYHYRNLYIRTTARVWHPMQRNQPDCATGLRLPAPPRHVQFEFSGHRLAFEASSDNRALALASVGAGASNWHFNAGGDFGPEHARHRCVCGDLAPSRPHLAWACESFAECRRGIALPEDRAAERLLAKPVPQRPPSPGAIDLLDFQEEIQACVARHLSSPTIFMATDGSSKEDVGSFAVAVQDTLSVCAAGDSAEDQTPFRMELQAIAYALRAAALTCADPQLQHQKRCKRLFLAVDCQSAIAAIEGTGGFDYLLLLLEIRHHRRRLLQYGVRTEFIWTPAHGRWAHDPESEPFAPLLWLAVDAVEASSLALLLITEFFRNNCCCENLWGLPLLR